MKKYKHKCANCGNKFESKSKDYQDLCSQKCMNEIEKYLIAGRKESEEL